MQRYRVIALAVSGHGSKIHRSGEVVTEGHFPPGRAVELVKHGFLLPTGAEPGKPATSLPEAVEATEKEEAPAPAGMPGIDDMTPKEIKVRLELKGITYDPKANKQKLYALLTQE